MRTLCAKEPQPSTPAYPLTVLKPICSLKKHGTAERGPGGGNPKGPSTRLDRHQVPNTIQGAGSLTRRTLLICLLTKFRRRISQLGVLITLLMTRGPRPVPIQKIETGASFRAQHPTFMFQLFGVYWNCLWSLVASELGTWTLRVVQVFIL